MRVESEAVQQCFRGVSYAVLISFATTTSAAAQEMKKVEVLKILSEVYNKRREKMNPIWLRFELSHAETAEWRRARGDKEPEPRKWIEENEFARKGMKTRVWSKNADPSEKEREYFRIFNGDIEITPSNEPNVFLTSKSETKNLVIDYPLSITGEDTLYRDLQQWAGGKIRLTVTADHESREMDENVRVVEFLNPESKWQGKLWLLPEKDWGLLRYETYNEKNGPVDKWQGMDYQELRGLTYPKRGVHEHYLGDGKLGYTVQAKIKHIETEAAKIPESLFQFEIPKGASTYDIDLRIMDRNAKTTQSHLDEVVKRSPRPSYFWRRWRVVTVFTASLILLAVAVYYWRRKLSRSGS